MAVNTGIQGFFLENLEASNLAAFLPDEINYLTLKTSSFKAGQLSLKLNKWRKLTSDAEVLTTVAG